METSCSYTDAVMFFSSDERKWISKIRRMAETNPSEVIILRQPEENDGCIYAKLPSEYLKIAPKRHIELSDEQREARAERLRELHKANKNNSNGGKHAD